MHPQLTELRFGTEISAAAKGNLPPRRQQAPLELILSDGSTYSHAETFLLADRQVDPKTGTIRIAVTFPKPNGILRPGQFGRVRAVTTTLKGALLVPQRAVTELQGSYQVAVVGGDNIVTIHAKPRSVLSIWSIANLLSAIFFLAGTTHCRTHATYWRRLRTFPLRRAESSWSTSIGISISTLLALAATRIPSKRLEGWEPVCSESCLR